MTTRLARARAYLGEVLGLTPISTTGGWRDEEQIRLNTQESKGVEPYGSFGWTLQRVQSALESLERGCMSEAFELYLAMTRDPIILHGLMMREAALSKVKWSFQRTEGMDDDYFAEWQAWWWRCWPRDSQGVANRYRVALGMAPLNATWRPSPDRKFWRPTLHTKTPASLEWIADREIYKFNSQVRYQDRDGKQHKPSKDEGQQLDMWPLNGQRWMLVASSFLEPHHFGAFRSLAVAWYMGAEAQRWHSAHNRRHGTEWLGVKMPEDQRETKDAKALLQACVTLENMGVVPLPQRENGPNWDLELYVAKTDASQSMERMRIAADEYKTLVLVGVLETSGGSSSSDAKAQTQDRVALRFTRADAAAICKIHDELQRTACMVNGRDPDTAITLHVVVDDPAEEAIKADRQKQAAGAQESVAKAISTLDATNAARAAAGLPIIVYEPDYLAEQAGVMLTRAQDGTQSLPQ